MVLPVAAIEQHGPHLPVYTDTLLCETVVRMAVERADLEQQLLVAPTLCYGNSHHHLPFPGVLSLTSDTYMATLTQLLEGLVRSGFRRLAVVNGHGGNTSPNDVVAMDLVYRYGHDVSVATGAYWDIAQRALTQSGLLEGAVIPGHAGKFETALVLAIRPDTVQVKKLRRLRSAAGQGRGLNVPLHGGRVQIHGVWASGPGYTDSPAEATADEGHSYLERIVESVAEFLIAFHRQ